MTAEWEYKFDRPAGLRILRSRFIGIIHFNGDLWWSDDAQCWARPEEFHEAGIGYSNTAPCNSFKAFKRHLRRHPNLAECGEVILVSRFRDCDIRAVLIRENSNDR